MQPDCLEAVQPIDPPAPPVAQDPAVPAAWALLVLVLLLTAFEVWALAKHKNTISHMFQRLSRAFRWFRALALIGLIVLGWHLLFGFPW